MHLLPTLLSSLLALGLAVTASQPPEEAAAPAPAPPATTRTEPAPGHRAVRSVHRLVPGGGRVDWSTQGDRLAFDRTGPDGHRQVWTVRPDGKEEHCLSCDVHDFRKAHVIDPVWHPSGDLVVVQVQRLRRRPDQDALQLAGPQRAVASELWTLPREGRQAFALTPEPGNRTAPHVSYEAGQLLWSERVKAGDREATGGWGEWAVRVADWKVRRGVPRLGKVRDLQPWPDRGLLLAQGFTPDDRGLLVEKDGALYRVDLGGEGAPRRVAGASGVRFGPARYGPSSDRLAWASTRGLAESQPAGRLRLPFRSDLWLALEGPDGTFREERLTFFNDPASDHFLGEALIADLAWSPAGDRLALQVLSADSRGGVEEALWIVTLDPRALGGGA